MYKRTKWIDISACQYVLQQHYVENVRKAGRHVGKKVGFELRPCGAESKISWHGVHEGHHIPTYLTYLRSEIEYGHIVLPCYVTFHS